MDFAAVRNTEGLFVRGDASLGEVLCGAVHSLEGILGEVLEGGVREMETDTDKFYMMHPVEGTLVLSSSPDVGRVYSEFVSGEGGWKKVSTK
jgi:hypothetical protein